MACKVHPCASCRILPDKAEQSNSSRPSHDPVPVVTGFVRKALIRVPASAKIRLTKRNLSSTRRQKQRASNIINCRNSSSKRPNKTMSGFLSGSAKRSSVREKVPYVDWTRCDPVACFLVENWCEWLAYERPPSSALLFFRSGIGGFLFRDLWQETWQPVH